VRVARKLADLSAIDEAHRREELSYAKVRALLRIATQANEAMILEYTRSEAPHAGSASRPAGELRFRGIQRAHHHGRSGAGGHHDAFGGRFGGLAPTRARRPDRNRVVQRSGLGEPRFRGIARGDGRSGGEHRNDAA
jgi:hypothetical protein